MNQVLLSKASFRQPEFFVTARFMKEAHGPVRTVPATLPGVAKSGEILYLLVVLWTRE